MLYVKVYKDYAPKTIYCPYMILWLHFAIVFCSSGAVHSSSALLEATTFYVAKHFHCLFCSCCSALFRQKCTFIVSEWYFRVMKLDAMTSFEKNCQILH